MHIDAAKALVQRELLPRWPGTRVADGASLLQGQPDAGAAAAWLRAHAQALFDTAVQRTLAPYGGPLLEGFTAAAPGEWRSEGVAFP